MKKQTSTLRLRVLARLWRYLGYHKALLLLSMLLSVGAGALALYGPKLSGEAINLIEAGPGNIPLDRILVLVLWMLGCYLASAVLTYLLRVVMIRLSRHVARRMRHDVFEKLTTLPVSYFDSRSGGDIVSVITYDVETVNQSLSSDFVQIVQSAVTVLVSLVMMLTIAPILVLIFAVTIPFTVWFTRWMAGRVRPMFRHRSKKLGELNGFVEEMLAGQKTIRAYGREEAVLAAFDRKNTEAVEAYTRTEANGTVTGPSVMAINNVSLALVSVMGALLYLRGGIRLGDLAAFVQYSRKFSGPINEVANIVAELQSAVAAAERVFALIDAEPEPPDAEDAAAVDAVRGEVSFSDVAFSYVEGTPIIKGLDLHATPGSLVAIVGPTGAGKTTLINLLMRFYDIGSGVITLDGRDIRTLRRDDLRRAFAMVLQDPFLFRGTVYENIAYGRPSATRQEVEAAARAAHIHSYIMTLPEGYDTVLTDNGAGISKGQRQLLTIARAMLTDAPMLILDEATSNVDTTTELEIHDAMQTLMQGRTSFVIAHRLSTIQNADVILVMRDGRIVEMGTHDELVSQDSFYRALYLAQFDTLAEE